MKHYFSLWLYFTVLFWVYPIEKKRVTCFSQGSEKEIVILTVKLCYCVKPENGIALKSYQIYLVYSPSDEFTLEL